MYRKSLQIVWAFILSLVWMVQISAQSSSGWIPTTPINAGTPPAATPLPSPPADSSASSPMPSLSTVSLSSKATTADSDTATMTSSDFVIDGVSYAKVLYLEEKVWIRPPGESTFHQLTESEPIAVQSVIYTGPTGTLDFATGPGMAVRMVPDTLIIVDQLPQPGGSAPAASQVGVKKGTVFSALGREDGQAIDFKVRTPLGVAGAKGTMFATTASAGQSEVDMLHGTVNFETPDHQTSQITAGESQQISGAGGQYQFGQHRALNPAESETFFNHAGGLLEHASGYGVVRRGLGADVARTMQERGYKLPKGMQERLQNAGKVHYQNKPVFNRTRRVNGSTAAEDHPAENHSSSTAPTYHPGANRPLNSHPGTERDRDSEWDQDGGRGRGGR